ncbi:hypothetical protein [Pseudomonas sp. NFACC45]|uniref:hypothetical protein n=1 Tax=Pseudomonas sp. NFACC45 TaxID=1566201 RepID=UPI0008E73ED9|nr:hypothetical protein [Pseudomonas sp. NFACC45]SFG64579.1 hypothetical protein SAMN03159297_00631 [Pseudomonas sp. NFACC45]
MPMTLDLAQKEKWISEMKTLTTHAKWGVQLVLNLPTGMKNRIPLYPWLKGPETLSESEPTLPTQRPPTSMNCWESLLVSGYYAGLWNKNYIVKAITKTAGTGNEDSGFSKLAWYMSRNGTPFMPNRYRAEERALIIMFGDTGEHFALTCGEGKIIELDKAAQGVTDLQNTLQRAPYYTYKRVYVAPPPTLSELNEIT